MIRSQVGGQRVGEVASANRIELTSGTLHVESNGDPLARLILCVHGLSANCRSFDRYWPVLAAAGYHGWLRASTERTAVRREIH